MNLAKSASANGDSKEEEEEKKTASRWDETRESQTDMVRTRGNRLDAYLLRSPAGVT